MTVGGAHIEFHQSGSVPARIQPAVDRSAARVERFVEKRRQQFIIRQAIRIDCGAFLHDFGFGTPDGFAAKEPRMHEFDMPQVENIVSFE